MKGFKLLFLLPALMIGLGACSPTLSPLTQNLYEESRWTDSELKRIQFYLSDNIVLRRELSGGSSEIISGKIKIVDGRQVEEIFIRKGTPGVFLFSPKDNRLAVSFEEGGNDRFLVFGPNPKAGSRFVLLASEWDRRQGTVTYEGRKFSVDASSAYAALMIDLKKVRKVTVQTRTAGGRKVR
jgi:hypothetical protein